MTNINAFPELVKFELDDDIVLDNSNALTGVRIFGPGEELECEIFHPATSDFYEDYPDDLDCILIYPLNGEHKPFIGPVRPYERFDEGLLEAVAVALQDRALGHNGG